MDIKITIEGGSGTLDLQKSSGLQNNIFFSLNIERGSWWFLPNFGSRLYLLRREKDTARALKSSVSYAKEALQWMLEDGRAKKVDATAARVDGGLVLTIAVTAADGAPVNFTHFVPVGE